MSVKFLNETQKAAIASDVTNFIQKNIDRSQNGNKAKKVSEIIHYNDLNSIKQRIKDWVASRLVARHAFVPDWTDLIRVYDYIKIDSHVFGIMNGIRSKMLKKGGILKKPNGEIDEELTKLLKSSWFTKYHLLFVESMFFPYSLVELGEYENGKFYNLQPIKREYVVPQYRSVKMWLSGSAVPRYNRHYAQTGVTHGELSQEKGDYLLDYFESDDRKDDYIFMECPIHDLGLFDMAAPHALGKMGTYSFFLDYLQKFVEPFKHGRTDLADKKRHDNMIKMFNNWGGNGYAITDTDDEIMLLESQGAAIAPYTELFKYSNNEISKAFASAIGIFDEKTFVGSAEAGERMLENVVEAITMHWENNINDELIPRWQMRDSRLKGLVYEVPKKENIPYKDRIESVVKLAGVYKLDPDEVSEKTGFKIEEKEIPEQLQAPGTEKEDLEKEPSTKKEAEKEPVKNIYPLEMVENAERALSFLEIKEISDFDKSSVNVANKIISNKPLSESMIKHISWLKLENKPYTISEIAISNDLLGGGAGKNWAIEEMKK